MKCLYDKLSISLHQERLSEVETFQRDALLELALVQQRADNHQPHPTANLEQLLQRGEQLHICVPEMSALKLVCCNSPTSMYCNITV